MRSVQLLSVLKAELMEAIIMVHARCVLVTPGNLNRVASDQLNPGRANIRAHRFATQNTFSGLLIDAVGARALKANLEIRKGEALAIVPLE